MVRSGSIWMTNGMLPGIWKEDVQEQFYLMVKSMVSRNSFWKSLNRLQIRQRLYCLYYLSCLILFVGQKTMEPIGTIWFGRWTSIIHCVLVRKKRYWLLVLPAFSSIFTEIDAPCDVLKYLGIWNPWTHPARLISEWGWIPISPVGDEHP